MLISAVREDLCLDYANSRSWRGSEAPTERLNDMGDLLAWVGRVASAGTRAMRPIEIWSREHRDEAAALFRKAITTRETIYRVFSAIAAGETTQDRELAVLRSAIAAAPVRRELVRAGEGYAWRIDDPSPTAVHLLAPVLWSAGDLLLDAQRRRIRRCANEECLWLFLDESKTGTRRWCDMASCGNRAKARRHYAKVKQG